MTQIVVKKVGKVDEVWLGTVLRVMRESHGKILLQKPEMVDLYFFQKTSALSAFLERERIEHRVSAASEEESFLALHDAWTGIPRIMVSEEKLRKVPEIVAIGGINHEVGHSILHGSPEYYAFPMPKEYREVSEKYGLAQSVMNNILTLTAIAVKDYEVTRLLLAYNFLEEQAQFCLHFLRPEEEDRIALELAKHSPSAMIVLLVASIKVISCAAPILGKETYGSSIMEAMRSALSFLPTEYEESIIRLCSTSFLSFGADTFSNVNCAANEICEEVIVPILDRGVKVG